MKKLAVITFLLLMFIHFEGFAQMGDLEDALGFNDQVNDTMTAAIDASIYVLLVFGGCLGLWQLRKVSPKGKDTRV